MARYATWADVKTWMDNDPGMNYDEPDVATLQMFENTQEAIFENEIRGFLAVPIDATASPDAFAQAKSVCAMRGAAQAIDFFRQAESTEARGWWAAWLDAHADKLVAQMKQEASRATDHEVATNPVEVVPVFTGLPSAPTFYRGQKF